MAEPYLTQLRDLFSDCGIDRGRSGEIVCRQLPENDHLMLLNIGGKPLRYFPNAPVKKGYVVLPNDVEANQAELKKMDRARPEQPVATAVAGSYIQA